MLKGCDLTKKTTYLHRHWDTQPINQIYKHKLLFINSIDAFTLCLSILLAFFVQEVEKLSCFSLPPSDEGGLSQISMYTKKNYFNEK